GKVIFRLGQQSSGSARSLSSSASYPAAGNTWVHVAATYDGTTVRLYLDGEEDNSRALAPGPVPGNALPLMIGRDPCGTGGFSGGLADVRVYGTALGAADIRALADTPPPPQAPPAPVSPANSAAGVPLIAELVWQPVEGAGSYEVEVSAS